MARLAGVMLGVQLGRLVVVGLRMEIVGVGDMGVVAGLFAQAGRMGLGCGMVMAGGVFVVRDSVPVVVDLFIGGTCYIPVWVRVSVALALGLGTMIGWKRIVVTVGEKIGKAHLT